MMIPKLDRSRFDWEPGVRALLSTVAPLVVLASMGRLDLGIYASFSAFTGLYGRGEPYGRRWLTLLVAACCLFSCVVAGAWVQSVGEPLWIVTLGLLAVISAGVLLTSILQWIPRGAIFFVFAFLGCSMKPLGQANLSEVMLVSVLSVSFSWIVGMSGLVPRLIPSVGAKLRPLNRTPARRLSAAWSRANLALILISTLAALASMGVASLTGIAEHQYWSAVTVVAIFSGPAALVSFDRIGHRIVGTLVGVGVAAALLGGQSNQVYLICVIAACTFMTELVVAQHYGLALAFITPLALGATNLGLTQGWEALFVDRARETILGGFVCFLVVVLARKYFERRGYELPA